MIKTQFRWAALAAGLLSLLLQGCATTSSPATASIRQLPPARIELNPPPLQVNTQIGAAPGIGKLFARGGHALGKVLQSALGFTGIRYRYGGVSPLTGFDCSGFVGYVFRESAGLKLPRASHQMAGVEGRQLSRQQLEPGDLVFFAHRKRVNHVGIYLGSDRFIHAPSTGGRVRTDELSNRYWKGRFVGGKRVLDPAGDAVVNASKVAGPGLTSGGAGGSSHSTVGGG